MTPHDEAIIKAHACADFLCADLRSAYTGAPVAEAIVIERLLEDAVRIAQTLRRLRSIIDTTA